MTTSPDRSHQVWPQVACAAVTPPRSIVVEHDGLQINALDWGGDGPPLLLQHPNGFCAGFFDPVAQTPA